MNKHNVNPALLETLQRAQASFQTMIEPFAMKGLSEQQYTRFLTMQYHLTKGVQRPFMLMAASTTFQRRPKMREFLFRFAIEEELHFRIAEKDLENLNSTPGPMPLDVEIWWKYFEPYLFEKPLVRLGATVILENLTQASSETLDQVLKHSLFLNSRNTKFLQIHRHEELPHGDQILDALATAELSPEEWSQVTNGAQVAATLYTRILNWVMNGTA